EGVPGPKSLNVQRSGSQVQAGEASRGRQRVVRMSRSTARGGQVHVLLFVQLDWPLGGYQDASAKRVEGEGIHSGGQASTELGGGGAVERQEDDPGRRDAQLLDQKASDHHQRGG